MIMLDYFPERLSFADRQLRLAGNFQNGRRQMTNPWPPENSINARKLARA